MANRLKKVIGDLVLPDKTFCIPGRSIYENIFLVLDLMCACYDQNDFGIFFLTWKKISTVLIMFSCGGSSKHVDLG